MPEPSSFSRACTASRTSDPGASSVTWRGPQLDSCSTCPISVLSPFGLNPPISCSASVFRAIPFALRSGWTRIQVSIWPPFIEVPTLISRDFFCPLPQCWRGSAHFPLERLDGNGATIHARTPRFLSALCQLDWGDASSVHVGVLPQVLSGLHERAVCHESQARFARYSRYAQGVKCLQQPIPSKFGLTE